MTIENYDKATKILDVIKRTEERLKDLIKYNTVTGNYNPSEKRHRVELHTDNRSYKEYFYLEVLNNEMVEYLVKQEIKLLKARLTKCQILLSKL